MPLAIRPVPLRPLLAASLACLLLAGCSSPLSPAANAGGSQNAIAAASGAAAPGSACAMLDAETMSGILGEMLTAEPHDETIAYGHTECHYYGADHDRFRIVITIQRGDAQTLRMGMHIPPRGPATSKNPYADLGDGARQGGPVLDIVSGADLIEIDSRAVFVDSKDLPKRREVAERILQTLDPKLAANPVTSP